MCTFLLGRFKSWQGLFYLKEGSCLSIFPPFSVHPGSEHEQGRWWHLKAVSGGVQDACRPCGSPVSSDNQSESGGTWLRLVFVSTLLSGRARYKSPESLGGLRHLRCVFCSPFAWDTCLRCVDLIEHLLMNVCLKLAAVLFWHVELSKYGKCSRKNAIKNIPNENQCVNF